MVKQTLDQACEEEMHFIRSFVEEYRSEHNVTPTLGERRMELSEEAFGEGHIALYQNLIPTTEGYGMWGQLQDATIRQMVVAEIRKDLERYKPAGKL